MGGEWEVHRGGKMDQRRKELVFDDGFTTGDPPDDVGRGRASPKNPLISATGPRWTTHFCKRRKKTEPGDGARQGKGIAKKPRGLFAGKH